MKVALVCFANTCRSPVAEALLRAELRGDPDIEVFSRGVAGGDGTTPLALVAALAKRGIELSGPYGRPLVRDEARSADLLLFVERRLLREAVVTDPSLWSRSFTVREFARRGFNNPPDASDESFASWLGVLHAGRSREEMLGENPSDDVDDPGLGGDEASFEVMIALLESEMRKVAPLLIGWSSRSDGRSGSPAN